MVVDSKNWRRVGGRSDRLWPVGLETVVAWIVVGFVISPSVALRRGLDIE